MSFCRTPGLVISKEYSPPAPGDKRGYVLCDQGRREIRQRFVTHPDCSEAVSKHPPTSLGPTPTTFQCVSTGYCSKTLNSPSAFNHFSLTAAAPSSPRLRCVTPVTPPQVLCGFLFPETVPTRKDCQVEVYSIWTRYDGSKEPPRNIV